MFTRFFHTFWGRLTLCVSPPLVGAVLLVLSGLSVSAASKELTVYHDITPQANYTAFSTNAYRGTIWTGSSDYSTIRINFTDLRAKVAYDNSSYKLTKVILHMIVSGRDYALEPFTYNTLTSGGVGFLEWVYATPQSPIDIYCDLFNKDDSGDKRSEINFYLEILYGEFSQTGTSGGTTSQYKRLTDYIYCDYSGYYGETGVSTPDLDNPVVDGLDEVNKTIQNQFDEEKGQAAQQGSDAEELVGQLDSVKNKWEILWYPITFTNRVLQVFTGGTQAVSYKRSYASVTGFRYDEATGYLEPVIDASRASPARSAGTIISLPPYTLPILNVQLWDGYTFDLSQVKESNEALFNALYVVITVMELYWIVGFLRDKYEEVFG